MKLQGKNVVITGASLGLGRALAQGMLVEGANLLICARDAAELEKTGRELQQAAPWNQRVRWQVCDVSDEQQINALATFGQNELGDCDILINNAGIQGPAGPLDEVPWTEWKKTIEVDLFGVALATRTFLPQLKRRPGAKIINLSGGGATAPRAFYSAYAAAKTAVVRLTETLAEELKEHRIDVNAIAPGALNTRMTAETIAAGAGKAGAKNHAAALESSQRAGSDFADAVALCLFLAGPESTGITGKLISAKWDNWRDLKAPLPIDLYTLRRVLPEDAS